MSSQGFELTKLSFCRLDVLAGSSCVSEGFASEGALLSRRGAQCGVVNSIARVPQFGDVGTAPCGGRLLWRPASLPLPPTTLVYCAGAWARHSGSAVG